MHHRSRARRGLFLSLLALLFAAAVPFAGQAHAQHGDGILQRLQDRYEQTHAIRARFTQTVGGRTLQGTLILSGDRYRIETPQQILVTDGETAWTYTAADDQVLVNDVIEDETAFSPTAFFTRYPDRFDVRVQGSETIAGAAHDVLALTPKHDDAFLQQVTLWVRRSDAFPTRVRVVDGNGTELTFDLSDVEMNPTLSGDVFQFRPQPGTEVVDLRS